MLPTPTFRIHRPSGLVRVYSRYGEIVEEFSINEPISHLQWDSEGELLAVTSDRSPPTLVLYEISASNVQTIDASIGAGSKLLLKEIDAKLKAATYAVTFDGSIITVINYRWDPSNNNMCQKTETNK